MERLGCSIEMEPRTLSVGQIKLAQVAAVDIIQNTEPDEASNIFTEGMIRIEMAEKREQVEKLVEADEEGPETPNGSWDFPCGSYTFNGLLDRSKIKEPASSPF